MSDLLELLQHAILNTLDDQAGFVISGGLDSSTVRTVAADLGAGNLPTFTGYYPDHGPAYDERQWAHLVASPEHHDIPITPHDFVENFERMMLHIQPPFMGPGTFGQYMVGRYIAANTDVRVVISGEGADELFGGYARQIIVAGHNPPDGYENYVVPDGYPDTIDAALEYDFVRLPLLLAVDDQCMAAHGLEARAPFTDPNVQQFALALPAEQRVGKTYLRNAVRGLVPDAIIDRTDKRGFPTPLVAWAQTDPVREFVHDRLGYTPDPAKPWDRQWWLELCENCYDGDLAAIDARAA